LALLVLPQHAQVDTQNTLTRSIFRPDEINKS
jgi:hypothetical protein